MLSRCWVTAEAALGAIAAQLNGQPRRVLGWRTPADALAIRAGARSGLAEDAPPVPVPDP